jgi:hypothetical protein
MRSHSITSIGRNRTDTTRNRGEFRGSFRRFCMATHTPVEQYGAISLSHAVRLDPPQSWSERWGIYTSMTRLRIRGRGHALRRHRQRHGDRRCAHWRMGH